MDWDLTRIETYLKKRKGELDDKDGLYLYEGFMLLVDSVYQYINDQELQDQCDFETYLDLFISSMRGEYKKRVSRLKEMYANAVKEAIRFKERIF